MKCNRVPNCRENVGKVSSKNIRIFERFSKNNEDLLLLRRNDRSVIRGSLKSDFLTIDNRLYRLVRYGIDEYLFFSLFNWD